MKYIDSTGIIIEEGDIDLGFVKVVMGFMAIWIGVIIYVAV